jgi:hypothetical protein
MKVKDIMKCSPEELLEMLEESGELRQNEFLRLMVYWCRRAGDLSDVYEYLHKNHDDLERIAKKFDQLKRRMAVCPFYPTPHEDDFPGNVFVGFLNEYRERYHTSLEKLTMHTLILGTPGAGKSNANWIITTSAIAKGATVWVIDPKGEFREYMKALPGHDFVVMNQRTMMINPLEPPARNIHPLDWIAIISEILALSCGFMYKSKIIAYDAIKSLYKSRGIFDGSDDYPTIIDLLKYLYSCKKGFNAKRQWKDADDYSVILLRIKGLVNSMMFCARRSMPVEKLQKTNLVIETQGVTAEEYSLMISILGGYLYHYRLANPFDNLVLLSIEEARKPFSNKSERSMHIQSDPYLVEMMTKSRAMKMGFILISHEPSSLAIAAMANVHTMFLMRLAEGHQFDAAARTLMLNQRQREFYLWLRQGDAIVRDVDFPSPFLLHFPEYPVPHRQTTIEDIRQRLAWYAGKVGFDLEANIIPDDSIPHQIIRDIEDEQKAKAKKEQLINPEKHAPAKPEKKPDETVETNAKAMLHHLTQNQFIIYNQISKAIGIHPDKGIKARRWLEERGLIIVHPKMKTRNNSVGMMMEVTEKGYRMAGGKPPKGKGSFTHKLYADYISVWLKSHGRQPEIEANLDGKLVDVFDHAEKTAYEITLHFSNVVENIEKDLEKGAENIVIVTEKDEQFPKVRSQIKGRPELKGKVFFMQISDFLEKKEKKK